jgi:hypothetical protein
MGKYGDLAAHTGDIDGFQYLHQSGDIGVVVGDDQGVRGRVGEDDAAFGDHGGEQPFDFVRIGKAQGHQLGDDLIIVRVALGPGSGFDIFGACVRRRDDLDQLAGLHSRETVNIEDRFEHLVGLINRYFGRGDDGDLTLDPLVDNEIFAGEFADELDEHADVHIVEINGHKALRSVRRGLPAGCLVLGRGFGRDEQ